ncbi:MAG: amino acid ABC transporter substrate-binding protein [Proteobacteria bacterium]|nr:amino acid ABC transporter substrate-binding protein [Pseudomonadota bacterium]MDA1323692.1 amino acid ABC transporter substrate-binding protein [Pseudomonadota bacterium]
MHTTITRRMALAVASASAVAFVFGATVAASQGVIKIGTPLALTGGLADEGKKQKIAYDMWLKRVNAAGGIKVGNKRMKVELVEYDYQTNGKRAQQVAEKLITSDKVNFLSAPFGSGHTKIVAAVAERYGVPMLASVSSSLSVYNQGFKNLFGTLAPNTGLTDAMFKHFKMAMPNAKKVAILGRNDVFPKSMAKALSKDAKKFGYKVVYDELYPVGTLDHSSSLSRIKSLKPDWIYVTGYTADLVLARKQMADLGVHAPIVTMIAGPAYKEFVDGLGKLAEGVTSASWWHHAAQYKSDDVFGSTQNFYKAFIKREGHDPDYVHASSAAALIALQKAIEKAGSIDRAKVRKALTELDIVTFYGPIKFGSNGMNQARKLPIIQVQKGKLVVLAPSSIEQAKMVAVPK